MALYEFETIKNIGTISNTKNETTELRIIKWGYGNPKYDLRRWGEEGKKPLKGVTFTKQELLSAYRALKEALVQEKSRTIQYEVETQKGRLARIFQVFGEYKKTNKSTGYITYTSWGYKQKYDVREWGENFSFYTKGIALDDFEVKKLLVLIENELNINKKDEEYDTSSIDDDLLI